MTVQTQNVIEIFDRVLCGVDGTPESLEAAPAGRTPPRGGWSAASRTVADMSIAVHAGWAMSGLVEELDASARDALHRAIDEVHPASTQLQAGNVVRVLARRDRADERNTCRRRAAGHSRPSGMLVSGVA